MRKTSELRSERVTEDGRESECDVFCAAVQVKVNIFIC